jgi:hypothetical protein
VWQTIQQAGLEQAAEAVLLHLMRVADFGEPDTKRQALSRNSLGAGERLDATRQLSGPESRLLTIDRGDLAAGTNCEFRSAATMEIAHEALLRGWERLQGWLCDPKKRACRL